MKILTKVDEMHDGVHPGWEEYECSHYLVQIDVVVEGKDGGQTEASQQRDGVPQDQEHYQGWEVDQRPS